MEQARPEQITYRSEIARKGIHILSLGIPIIYMHVPHPIGISVLVGMTLVSFLIDVLRHVHEPSRKVLMLVVGDLLRKHELQSGKFTLTGATWVLIAATLSLGVFPPAVGVPAFCVLIVSDTFAALVGRRYGVRKFLDKSVVGTSTFIVTGCMVVATFGLLYTLPISYYLAGSLGAVCAGIAEAAAVRFRVDDNIAIPLSMAATMIIAEKLLHGVGLPLFSQLIQ